MVLQNNFQICKYLDIVAKSFSLQKYR